MLARLVRVDPELLRPIQHRGETAQSDLMRIKVRAVLLEARNESGEYSAGAEEGSGRTASEL
jgi:hypothetical protein